MADQADGLRKYSFKHPIENRDRIQIDIPLYDGLPLVQQQDAKHLRKMFRNQIYSGARALIIGNNYAAYHQVHEMAFSGRSAKEKAPPIMKRDVVKVDRQDDNAAARLFSSGTLEWQHDEADPNPGLTRFLFVFGELIDSCQSRKVTHLERIKMGYRALFFLALWKEFLQSAGYPLAKYYVSHQCADISRILVAGMISLILVYRDYGAGQPLLLWMHSTEPVEHTFGEARKLCPNFTLLEFLYLTKKLYRVMSSFRADGPPSADKACASGYNHGTYLRRHDINLDLLSIFPSDKEIEAIMKVAYGEAYGIMVDLGYSSQGRFSFNKEGLLALPSITQWYHPNSSNGTGTPLEEDNGSSDDEGEEFNAEDRDDEVEENRCKALHRGISNATKILEGTLEEVRDLPNDSTIRNGIFAATAIDLERMDTT
jgi:hypothetical protein